MHTSNAETHSEQTTYDWKSKSTVQTCLIGRTIFALGNVAALVSAFRVSGVTPGSDAVAVRITTIVQLQAIGSGRSPSIPNSGDIILTLQLYIQIKRIFE